MLDDKIYEQITAFTDKANIAFEEGKYGKAFNLYLEAYKLIPDPVEEYDASTWVLTALGDCMFLSGDYEKALKYLELALYCPDVEGSFFINLRLGQVYYELGNKKAALEQLNIACSEGGKEIFENDNPKYFEFLVQNGKNIPNNKKTNSK